MTWEAVASATASLKKTNERGENGMPITPGRQFQFDTLYQGEMKGQDEKFGLAKRFGSLYLYQAGELSCINGYEVPPHLQWCHEISYIISGEGLFTTDSDTDLLLEGDIHFSPKGSTHAIRTTENSDLRYAYIGFLFAEDIDDEEICRLREFYAENKVYKATNHNKLLIPFFRNLDELYNQGDFHQSMVETYLLQVLITVYRSILAKPQQMYFPAPPEDNVGRAVYAVIKYIDAHIYEKLEIKRVAQDVGYNYSYISNVFCKSMGITLQRYISNKKIQKAIELMKFGKLNPSQVAKRLDYASVQSFNKAFKRTMGVAPTEFIRSIGQKAEESATV